MTEPSESAKAVDSIYIDFGSRSKKAIRKLKNGRGKLMAEVEKAVDQVAEELRSDGEERAIVAVVCIYRRKRRKKRRSLSFPLPFSL